MKRADYIQFYRNQALNYMTNAFAVLGERGNLRTAFEKVERGVRDITAREHIARYNALQQQVEAERERAIAGKTKQTSITIGILAFLLLAFAVSLCIYNSRIRRKNHLLAQQIADALEYKEKYRQLSEVLRSESASTRRHEGESQLDPAPSSLSSMTNEELYHHIDKIINSERLYCDPNFGRETIMERFHLSKERAGTVFSKGCEHPNLSRYILELRLEHAAKLLREQPDKTIVQIASESGFSSNAYFSNCFRQRFGMSPTDYRHALTE